MSLLLAHSSSMALEPPCVAVFHPYLAALTRLCARAASLHIEYPMLFKVQNRSNAKSTHCGVLEFSADEGMVYMPYWVRRSASLPATCLALRHAC